MNINIVLAQRIFAEYLIIWSIVKKLKENIVLRIILHLQDLDKELKRDLKGKLESVVVALLMPPREYLAHELRGSMKVSHVMIINIKVY